eukprot:TRINITY_DN35362_c0_g1_i1.p1 TRINITY_DN35362_c0_g1~~TRINITY_DN35362_c0_g1_i1.p1  ORF type:complete len:508 (+),score=93.76 TRINITY_DN35362_c0_g1_i1:949-2472(+)
MLRALIPVAAARGAAGLDAQSVGMALYGLRGAGGSVAAGALLAVLLPQVVSCPEVLSPKTLASALYGLQGVGAHPAGRGALRELAVRVGATPDRWEPESIVTALLGLRYTIDCAESRELLNAIAPRTAATTVPLSSEDTAICLLSLRQQGDSPGARVVLDALVPLVACSTEVMPTRLFSAALSGLASHGGSPGARRVIALLLPRALGSNEAFNQASLGSAVFGLHGEGDVPHVRSLLAVLHRDLSQVTGRLQPLVAAQLLHGLLGLSEGGPRVAPLLREVLLRLPSEKDNIDPQTASILIQGLVLCGAAVPPHIEAAAARGRAAEGKAGCAKERALQDLLCHAGVPGLQFNVMHETGFEFDILAYGRVAIEIGGPSVSYRDEGRRRLVVLRQRLLRKLGIAVRFVESHGRPLLEVVADVQACCGGGNVHDGGETTQAWRSARALAARGWQTALQESRWRAGPAPDGTRWWLSPRRTHSFAAERAARPRKHGLLDAELDLAAATAGAG